LSVVSNFGREALFLKELAHQPDCSPLVAPALNQHVENLALVIDGAPQVHPLAGDANDHLGAIDRSGVGGTVEVCGQNRARTSEPSAAPSHRKHPGRARRGAPPRRGSSA
jgi:hypothetical protein